jgi:ABC-type nitrate/sulfonate/bicarbonate transport system substrate-binding protein
MFLGAGAAAGTLPLLPRGASAQGLTTVKLGLPWVPDSFYAYAYIGGVEDFWRKRGLDVQAFKGTGSLTAAQALAAGQFDYAIIATSALIMLAAKKLPLVGLGIVDYNATMGVAVLADSPIRKPKDLEGKRIAQTLASADAPYFKPFAEKTGIDLSKVELVNADANVRNRSLMDKRVDAVTGIADSLYPDTSADGVATRYMLYGDYGIDFYGNCLVTRAQTLHDNPAQCQAVFDGLMEAVKFELTRPADVLRDYLQAVPESAMSKTSPEYAKLGIQMLQFSVLSEPGALANGLGWGDAKKLDAMIDLVAKYQLDAGTPRPDRAAVLPLPFPPRSRLTPAQWQAAQQQIQEISKALRA